MVETAFLIAVFALAPLVIILLVVIVARMPRHQPAASLGWMPPPVIPAMPPQQQLQQMPQAQQITILQGPVCGCGGALLPGRTDAGSGMPSSLWCQSCGREAPTGPWIARERSL